MTRRSWIAAIFLGALGLAAGERGAVAADDFTFHHENVMGTSLELQVRAEGPVAARRAERRALAEIDRLAAILSGYDPSSAFRRWQSAITTEPVIIPPDLFAVLGASDRWRAETGGAFDPRVEALSRLWSRSAARGKAPTASETADAMAMMAPDAWQLGPDGRSAAHRSTCPLTIDAIAKGFIVERAANAALDPSRGVLGVLLNVGGDLRVSGDIGRTIGVIAPRADSESSPPLTAIEVRDRSVSTSGNSQRGWRIGGRWYSHILDPVAGRPVESVVGATVIADRGEDADALATALNVLPVAEGLRLADATPGVACLIVSADGLVSRNARWAQYERPHPGLVAFEAEPGKAEPDPKAAEGWGKDFELVVKFEINQPEAERGRYRRPYVAVWVEDRGGAVVRNLLLWVSYGGAGPYQWLPDMKRWYRADDERKKTDRTDMVQTISRPTRPPGSYQVIWDGKDDHKKPLPPGEYTIQIDAAREHGTYQNIRKTVTIGDRPFVEELKGHVEIRSAALEYRRKEPGK